MEQHVKEMEQRGCCECCGKEDQSLVIDPYMEEMEGVQRECFLCDECYAQYCADV